MTVSSTLEGKLRGREGSTVAARAAGALLGVAPVDERGEARFNAFVHCEYGTGWRHVVYAVRTSLAYAWLDRAGMRRGLAVAALLALGAAACADGGDEADGHRRPSVTVREVAASPREQGPSALEDIDDPRLPRPLVPPDEIVPGGPPPDGIPPIDRPRFQPAGDVDWLDDDEPVLALELEGESRAYPVQILTWHEIVNDTAAGVPVAITYCPLCNSAIAFDRRLDDRVLDFGTSGRLYRSALVMYDRQTESLWAHFTGQAVAGRLTGEELRSYPVSTVAWSDFRKAHGDALVLSRDTGFDRDYGKNPYPGYDDVDTSPFLFKGEVDGRLAAKTRIVGVELEGASVAVSLDALRRRRTMAVDVGGRQLLVWWKPGTASALESSLVAEGRDVGATGVFDAVLEGRPLSFRSVGESFEDAETNSAWDVLGRAIRGPLAGKALSAVPHVDTFWFAWAAYQPDTTIVSG